MKAKIKHWGYLALAFVLGGLCAFEGRRWLHCSEIDNKVAKPPVVVEFAETNLPIVLINTEGKCKQMTQERSILAKMSIIYNRDGQLNYVDTVSHRNQCFEYEGYTYIHVHGASSAGSDKKSFALRLVTDDGRREKHSFFGWKKSSKWCLLAEYKDGSLIRDALTYELARPYFDFVPHLCHCEVVIDGVYQGVYLIAEKVSRDRLGIKKVDKNDAFCSNGYIIEKDRNETFKSKYPARDSQGNDIGSDGLGFEVDYPKNLSTEQLDYIKSDFGRMEDAINIGLYSEYSKHIDVSSFVSYHLLQEFTNNPDGFIVSQKIYKSSGDSLFSMVIWDFDICYGNCITRDGWFTNVMRYKSKSNQKEKPFWWKSLAKDTVYHNMMIDRWRQFREGSFSYSNIENTIDSLQQLLTVHHAADRNSKAWNISDESNPLVRPHPFNESVDFIRNWIICRLDYLDSEFLGTANNTAKCDSACMELGRIIMFKK